MKQEERACTANIVPTDGDSFPRRAAGKMSRLVFLALIAGCAACESAPVPPPEGVMLEKKADKNVIDSSGQAKMTVQGVRMTEGNAVDCPQIQTDDGRTLGVSYLAPSIAIGQRVEVTGFMANMTTCRGPVLYVEEVTLLGN